MSTWAEDVERQRLNVFRRNDGGDCSRCRNRHQNPQGCSWCSLELGWMWFRSLLCFGFGLSVLTLIRPLSMSSKRWLVKNLAVRFWMARHRFARLCHCPVGGGSNAIGAFSLAWVDEEVKLVGAGSGWRGLDTDQHAATDQGKCWVVDGMKTYAVPLLKMVSGTGTPSAGLDYPELVPNMLSLKIPDENTWQRQMMKLWMPCSLTQKEGILPQSKVLARIWSSGELRNCHRPIKLSLSMYLDVETRMWQPLPTHSENENKIPSRRVVNISPFRVCGCCKQAEKLWNGLLESKFCP